MNESNGKDWPKGPNAITENFVKNDKDSEENLIALDEKDILERYLDDDEPIYFFKGAAISFFLCLLFWITLIILLK